MTPKPVRVAPAARRDVSAIARRYRVEAGVVVAFDFARTFAEALGRIGDHPAAGSPRYADLLGLPGVRFQTLRPFPHLVFYVELPRHVRIWRVLHSSRDIPALLG